MTRLRILGVPVDAVTEPEAVAWVRSALTRPGAHQIVTVNPEFIMRAKADPAFLAVLEGADLAIPDGAGLLWAARLKRLPLAQRVAGVDLVRALARAGAAEDWRFFFLGAGEGVAAAAAAVLQGEFPGLRISGTLSGSPEPAEDQAVTNAIRSAGADIVLVAFGAPAQDFWIARNLGRCEASVGMGVGGAFDFIAGRTQRAPTWMREHGLEWLHRLGREPWRWRRMLALPRFAFEILRSS